MRKLLKVTALTNVIALALVTTVNAQSLLPQSIQDILNGWEGATATEKVAGFIRLALTVAFGIVILAAVAYSIIAAIKYIRSQGDAGKVEEANKAIKAIFQGVAMMFVGIIGVVIVFFIFNVALPEPSLPGYCVKCPDTTKCKICSEGRKNDSGYYTLDRYKGHAYSDADCNDAPSDAEDCTDF